MDEIVKCECGNREFLYFWDRVRCPICHNEYKMTEYIISKSDYNEVKAEENWVRKFNSETDRYGNWSHFK